MHYSVHTQAVGGLPTMSLTTKGSWVHLGEARQASRQRYNARTTFANTEHVSFVDGRSRIVACDQFINKRNATLIRDDVNVKRQATSESWAVSAASRVMRHRDPLRGSSRVALPSGRRLPPLTQLLAPTAMSTRRRPPAQFSQLRTVG